MSSSPIEKILAALKNVKQTCSGQWQARCPAHEDTNPSLSIGCGKDDKVLLKCHAGCTVKNILNAIGLREKDLFPPGSERATLVATYDYLDSNSKLLYQVLRFSDKTFSQRRPGRNGTWINNIKNVPRVLYHLPDLAKADFEDYVFIVEGEKDADNLAALGFVTTTNSSGAGKWKHLSDYSVLDGRKVVIIPDKDKTGREHAEDVCGHLRDKASEIRVLKLSGPGKDASDWISAGGTRDELIKLLEITPIWSGQSIDLNLDPLLDGTDNNTPDDEPVTLGTHDPQTGRLVLSPRRTLPTAEAYIREFHTHRDYLTLINYATLLMTWKNNRYCEIEDQAIKKIIQPWLHESLRYVLDKRTGQNILVPFESNPGTVNAALESIRTYVHLEANLTPPVWLGDATGQPDPKEILPCRTMTLHIPTANIYPATPLLFTTNALNFDFNPDARTPDTWLTFLEGIWGDDLESIELLQEWFGYCLVADTSQQKMLLLVGPRRSGKGTIGRILTKLIGPGNVCGPTTGSLAGAFGLQPLVGKSLAIVSDARFSGQDISTVVERLLCISGEDSLTIDRKHKESVTLKLPTRFMFLTNELPRFNDSSNALVGRFMLLKIEKSWYGKEDLDLGAHLEKELPGILLWALQGWTRLRKRGRFIQPTASADAIQELEDLSSPVVAFVREKCSIGAGYRIAIDSLYSAWQAWCQSEGRSIVSTKQTFGRDLASAVPTGSIDYRLQIQEACGYHPRGHGKMDEPLGTRWHGAADPQHIQVCAGCAVQLVCGDRPYDRQSLIAALYR